DRGDQRVAVVQARSCPSIVELPVVDSAVVFPRPTTAITSQGRNCLLMVVSRKSDRATAIKPIRVKFSEMPIETTGSGLRPYWKGRSSCLKVRRLSKNTATVLS